ncbi:MAG: symporter small accessory protein [Desulfovibrio sp.]
MMLGLGSIEIALAFWLVIASAVLCIGYGAAKWNSGGQEDAVDPEREEATAAQAVLSEPVEEAAQ